MSFILNLLSVLQENNSPDIPVQPDMPDTEITLCFVSNQDGSTLSLSSTGNPTVDGLQYWKSGDSGWSTYTINTSFTLNAGDYVFFQNVNDYLSTSSSDYVYFNITRNGCSNWFCNVITQLFRYLQ